MIPPLLAIQNLRHVFPDGTAVLNDISLCIEKASFTILAGPNGSGKTVFMRHLNGLMRPTSGRILLDGIPITENLSLTRRRIGLVFQDADAQIVGQTVARDAAFGPENLRLSRPEIEKRVRQALAAAGLIGFDERRPHTLSGGEKRRLAVAGVLAMEPDILVLDEPFTGLDWPGCADLITVLNRLRTGGTTILLITHDLAKILSHADRLILMNGGRIHAEGNPLDIINEVEEIGVRRPEGDVSTMSWAREPRDFPAGSAADAPDKKPEKPTL